MVLFPFTATIEKDGPVGFLEPYQDYLSMGLVVLLGLPAVHAGTSCVFAVARRRTSPDVAGALRVTRLQQPTVSRPCLLFRWITA